MDITPFLPLITGAIGGAASAGVFKGPIQTLEDLWYENFGYNSSERVAYLKEKQAINLQKLRDETLSKTSKIELKNIQEPKLNIIGPALEASKYYIEEDELRIMFAKLIASSMDKSKNKLVHPSFVEVIKQLSSNDALILQEFKTTNRIPFGKILVVEDKKLPPSNNKKNSFKKIELPNELKDIGKLSLEDWTGKYGLKSKSLIDHFYISQNMPSVFENEFSISSLVRLGIIDTNEGIILSNKLVYSEIEEEFKLLKKGEFFTGNFDVVPKNFHLELRKGTIDLTPFGISFFETCV